MKRKRLIFYAIFSTFHLFIFFFSLYVDSQKQNIQFLLELQSKIWMLKYGSFFGLTLLVIDLFWDWRIMQSHKKEKDQLQHEINSVKAKLFDLQGNKPSTETHAQASEAKKHV